MDKSQISAPLNATLSTTSLEILPQVSGTGYKRTQIIITNTTAGLVATIIKGSNSAVNGQGIILQPNGSYVEASDGGFTCWQGAVQGICTGAGTLSIVETKEAN